MAASEQANLPQWSGHGFEIWFFVVLVPGIERALWVRLTRFADGEHSDARIWAVVSEAERVTAQREILPLDAMTCETERFLLRVGEAELGHGSSKGRCGRIAWEFRFEASDPVIERMPKLPGFVPVGTRATHPHAEGQVQGWVELDGRRLDLDGGLFTQMHIWGHQRVEWLRWAWVPRFADDDDAVVELTAVAPKAGGSNLCALSARVGGLQFDNYGLTQALRAQLIPIRPGVLHHVATGSGRRLVVRVWAAPNSFAGWDYRQIGGGDLHVAQSNLGHCELELYRKAGLGWRPERRLRGRCAALEFHGPDDYREFEYVGWDAQDMTPRSRKPSVSEPEPEPPPGPGRWIETLAPSRIVGLGLTYKEHARETASAPDPVVFEIDPGAWVAAPSGVGRLRRPASSRLRAALRGLDPSLDAALAEFGFMPAMFDYEAELGLLLVDGLADADAIDSLADGRVGLLLANDVTARSVQILGEGQPDRLAYWTAAKSMPGCKPTSPRTWIPAHFDLDAWPALRLETRVNGAVRQAAGLELLHERPRQMLARVSAALGPLPPGTLLLTGTPAGVAFTVPRWKRAMGERLLDRVGKLRAALSSYSGGAEFLRPGDLVDVRGGFLGSLCHVVEPEAE